MLGTFACARLRFVVEAVTPLRLSAFAGATLRGGFGHAFKRSVCVWPPGDCRRCLLKHVCSYPYVFETAPPPGATRLRNLDQVPRPYVLEPPPGERRFAPGERFEFGLVLVGRAVGYLPYFVLTFGALGEAGLGREGGRFRVVEVHAHGRGGSRRVYDAAAGVLSEEVPRLTATDVGEAPRAGRLAVEFATPVRIRSEGAVQSEVTFADLLRALLRRLSSLCYFHCGCEMEADFKGLVERAGTVPVVASDLRWHEQGRFSGRQRQWVEMGGLVGRVTFENPDWAPFWPLLKAGEWVHVGKGCVMGLGEYGLEPD